MPLMELDEGSIEEKSVPLIDKWIACEQEMISEMDSRVLSNAIRSRRRELASLKEHWQKVIGRKRQTKLAKEVNSLMGIGKIQLMKGGVGGSYLLFDENENPKFVITPFDEGGLALNNPEIHAKSFNEIDQISNRSLLPTSLNASVQNGPLSYDLAKKIGISDITPIAEMMVIKSEAFHDILDNTVEISGQNSEEAIRMYGRPDKEKLCLVQEYIPNTKELTSVIAANTQLSPDDIEKELWRTPDEIEQDDYEKCAILTWLIGDTNGYPGNFLISNECNSKTYKRRLWKINNTETFPNSNVQIIEEDGKVLTEPVLLSGLNYSQPNYRKPLSENGKKIINELSEKEIIDLMKAYEKEEEVIEAFKERVLALKEWANETRKVTTPDGKTITKPLPIRCIDARFETYSRFSLHSTASIDLSFDPTAV